MEIRDKVVIVTGASAGIGLATSLRLASVGAKLALAARSADKLRVLSDDLNRKGSESIWVPTDMRKREDVHHLVEETIKRFGRVDVLINNTGQGMAGLLENAGIDDYLKLIELNVFGPVYAMQAVIPKMRLNGGGMIVNVSSMVSKMHIPGLGFYASTKTALNILSETAGYELERDNIRVVVVFPRMTATEFARNSLGDQQLRQRQRSAPTGSITVDSADYVAVKDPPGHRDGVGGAIHGELRIQWPTGNIGAYVTVTA
jgi:short-subunit dehydrogenase